MVVLYVAGEAGKMPQRKRKLARVGQPHLDLM
jgi:hypothetical protein